MNEQGEGVHGTAEGYLDLVVDNRGEYKEKIATFVIRNFISAQPIDELTQVSKKSHSPETPDFAKELLEDNVTSTDEDLDEEPPF